MNQRPAPTCVTQLDGLTNFSNLPPASGVQLKTEGSELTLNSLTLNHRPAPTCVTQLDSPTNFSNLPTALQLKTDKSSTGGNEGPEGTNLRQLMKHHALINDPMFCPLAEVHSADVNKQTTTTSSSKYMPAYVGEETTATSSSNFLPAYAGEATTTTSLSKFLPAYVGDETTATSSSNFLPAYAGEATTTTSSSNFLPAYVGEETTVTSSSNFLPAYACEATTTTSLSKFLPASADGDTTVTGSRKFLPTCPRAATLYTGPDSILAPSSTKPMLESALDFSNSNSNKQTGKSGSVLSPPNLNKQTLQSRRVEFQPDKKQREYRTTYTTFHLQVLEKAFSKTQYPDFLTRAKLARKIGKDETRIYYWFQNRRAKLRTPSNSEIICVQNVGAKVEMVSYSKK